MIQRIARLKQRNSDLPSVRSVDCLLSGVAEGSHAAAENSVEDVGCSKSREEVLSHDYHMTEVMQQVQVYINCTTHQSCHTRETLCPGLSTCQKHDRHWYSSTSHS